MCNHEWDNMKEVHGVKQDVKEGKLKKTGLRLQRSWPSHITSTT